MATNYKITIRNLNTNQFNINGGIALNKGVYIVQSQGNNVGLINKFTKKPLVELTDFNNWLRYPSIAFNNISELTNYLTTYITEPGIPPSQEENADKLDLIIEKMNITNGLLESILTELQIQNNPQP